MHSILFRIIPVVKAVALRPLACRCAWQMAGLCIALVSHHALALDMPEIRPTLADEAGAAPHPAIPLPAHSPAQLSGHVQTGQSEAPSFRRGLSDGELSSPRGQLPALQARPSQVPSETPPEQAASAKELPHFIRAMSRMRLGITPREASPAAAVTGIASQSRAPLLTLAPVPVPEPTDDEPLVAVMPVMRGSITGGSAPPVAQPLADVMTTASLSAISDLAALADSGMPADKGRAEAIPMREKLRRPKSVTSPNGFRLADAVASAVMTYPEIRINEARVREAKAGIDMSRAGLYPIADIRLAAGGNFSGSYEGRPVPYKAANNAADTRFDGGMILRQLLFDFGATRSDVQRAEFLRDAEKLKLKEKVDEIAYKTSQNFLKVLEQRALLELIEDTIRSHEHLARVVQAHAKEGHGTLADVSRVNSRLVDVRAIRSDISLQLMAAEDQFQRLTRKKPAALADVPELGKVIPGGANHAIQQAIANNPRLGAIQATRRSAEKELEFQKASTLPRINLEVESESKNFRNHEIGRTQVEGRAMIAMRYRFMDGGLSSATNRQIMARIEGNEMNYLNEREQMEADIRQAYRAIESSGRKNRLVAEGVASSDRVRELYLEQFKGGKRSIFELLDGQMSYYTSRRSQIESQYEGRRAMFDILRSMGDLTRTLSQRG